MEMTTENMIESFIVDYNAEVDAVNDELGGLGISPNPYIKRFKDADIDIINNCEDLIDLYKIISMLKRTDQEGA